MRILDHLEMYTLDYPPAADDQAGALGPPSTILCSKGFWVMYLQVERKWFDVVSPLTVINIDLH